MQCIISQIDKVQWVLDRTICFHFRWSFSVAVSSYKEITMTMTYIKLVVNAYYKAIILQINIVFTIGIEQSQNTQG